MTELDSEHFHFYTNEELCRLALEDYKSKNDSGEELDAAAADNGDGTVTIQIYQNLGDHNSTAAWYQVDRITGEGEDVSSGNEVDLTNGSPDIDITHLDPASQLGDYYKCTVDETEHSSELLLSPEVPVTDFRVVMLEYVESENDPSFHVIKELFAAENLTPEKPLVIQAELSGTIPGIGITYLDRNGDAKLYTISISGLDGAPLLTEVIQK